MATLSTTSRFKKILAINHHHLQHLSTFPRFRRAATLLLLLPRPVQPAVDPVAPQVPHHAAENRHRQHGRQHQRPEKVIVRAGQDLHRHRQREIHPKDGRHEPGKGQRGGDNRDDELHEEQTVLLRVEVNLEEVLGVGDGLGHEFCLVGEIVDDLEVRLKEVLDLVMVRGVAGAGAVAGGVEKLCEVHVAHVVVVVEHRLKHRLQLPHPRGELRGLLLEEAELVEDVRRGLLGLQPLLDLRLDGLEVRAEVAAEVHEETLQGAELERDLALEGVAALAAGLDDALDDGDGVCHAGVLGVEDVQLAVCDDRADVLHRDDHRVVAHPQGRLLRERRVDLPDVPRLHGRPQVSLDLLLRKRRGRSRSLPPRGKRRRRGRRHEPHARGHVAPEQQPLRLLPRDVHRVGAVDPANLPQYFRARQQPRLRDGVLPDLKTLQRVLPRRAQRPQPLRDRVQVSQIARDVVPRHIEVPEPRLPPGGRLLMLRMGYGAAGRGGGKAGEAAGERGGVGGEAMVAGEGRGVR
mmetsp:Transcript_23803/g.59158  ORF Transcript_23803/g.59158 Transcript_23803/m.59158 type:complete len:520 (+) Transcript_23803:829-2388(+)